jgi:hypothetical protein
MEARLTFLSSASASAATKSFSSISSSVASAYSTAPPVPGVTNEPRISEEQAREKDAMANAQIVVAKDLKTWQEKFAKAADEGSDELEERITEITDRLVQNQARGVGKALIVQLEETVRSSLQTLKRSIISIVKEARDIETSEDALNAAVRKAGVAIKEKAQAVRTWRQSYDREANSLVSQSAETTFEILDNIRDLGLQEIGMRWAWTDGITHKDWKKYHQLKNKFDEWRTDVEKVLTEHPGLDKARAASEEVENQAMTIAEDAAKELARLKETGRWKISAGDSSDDFSTKRMPAVAAAAAKKVAEKVAEKVSELSEAVAPTSQGTLESVVSIASSSVADAGSYVSSIAASQIESVRSAASSGSASIVGTPQGSVESLISVGSSSASSLADKVTSSIIGTPQGTVESAVSVAKASGSSIMDQASSSILGASPGSVESVISAASKRESLSTKASSSIDMNEPEIVEKASNSFKSASLVVSESASSLSDALSNGASKASASLSSATSSVASSLSKSSASSSSSISSVGSSESSTASKKIWGGAMAAEVPSRQIILDKSDDTPMPITDSIAAKATEAYSAALSRASDNYYHARSVISARISGDQEPYHLEIFDALETAYANSVAAASSRLQDAVSAASTIVYGTPTPAYQSVWESLSSVAQSRMSEGLSAASAQYEEAKSYVGSLNAPAPTQQKLLDQIQEQYYAGVGIAHARYSEFINAASSAVMPTKTPEPFASAASENWEALVTRASSQIYDAPLPNFITKRLVSEVREYAAQATDGVASQYSAVQSLINELVSGKEPDFTESIYSRFSSAYYTGAAQVVSSASSYASEAYLSASSVVSSVFTPPPAIEAILDSASSRVNEVVDAASIQIYGSTTGYAEVAQSSIAEAASSAQKAISEAIWGTQTGTYESATSVAAERYASATAVISNAIYGQEQGAVESAQSRLSAAVESARVKLAEFAASAGEGANEYIKQASEGMEDFASSVMGSAKPSAKDEL